MRRHGPPLSRRALLAGGTGLVAVALVPAVRASDETMDAAIRAFTQGGALRDGRVVLDVPPLVDNGNSVNLSVTVESPMTAADHVRSIAVFNQKNPQPQVAVFHLGPRAGRAEVTTRVRLADSQRLVAIAPMSDGSLWRASTDVLVTLAACLE
ncbi:MAG: SoxY-related AACIE arm protein [Alphaproteobacteria bacterium]|nr:SoxY-related AACIE arm protein [Alphaproteobacteria bacterium]